MKLAIMQPYFFPYIGYFQLIASVDKFVIYDDVNFIKRGGVNRNNILVNGAAHMMTIPLSNGKRDVLICDVMISQESDAWRQKLLKTIAQAYLKAPMFSEIYPWFEQLLMSGENSISRINTSAIRWIYERCSLNTEIIETSTRYSNRELGRADRLADICKQEQAMCYINAIGGKELYGQSMFTPYGIELRFLEAEVVPYPQSSKEFIPGLSVLDIMMNCEPSEIKKMISR